VYYPAIELGMGNAVWRWKPA